MRKGKDSSAAAIVAAAARPPGTAAPAAAISAPLWGGRRRPLTRQQSPSSGAAPVLALLPGQRTSGSLKPGARALLPAQSGPEGPGAVTWWGSSCLPWLGYRCTPRVAAEAALFVNKEDNKPGGSGRGRRE